MFRNCQLRPWLRMRTCRPTYWGKRTAVLRQSKLCHQVVQLGFLFTQLKLQGRRGSSSVKARTMKGASGHRNSRQASPEQPPPSYEEIAGSSSQPGAAAGKPLPTDFPPSYTEQEQNVRVVYLPAPNFGPKSAKVVCSSCQVLLLVSLWLLLAWVHLFDIFFQASVTTTTSSRPSMMAWAASCVLCFTMLWPCFCVPFCVDSFKDVKHSCPNCNVTLGRYKGCI